MTDDVAEAETHSVQTTQPVVVETATATQPEKRGHFGKHKYVSPVDGATIEYGLWYPPNYDTSKAWPLIVFLHGSASKKNWYAPTLAKAGIPVRTVRSDLPFLVVFPLMRGTWSINGPSERDVLDTIEDVKQRARVDPDRIHLTGVSYGGFAAWALAAHYPQMFASLTVFASGGQPELVENLRNIPTRVFHGTADTNVRLLESQRMVEAMQVAHIPVEFTVFQGVQHVCWRKPYADKAFYAWMAARRRDAHPRRISYRTRSLRYNRAYWATIDSMIDSAHPANIDVFIPGGSQIMIHAENVGRLTLDPPSDLIPPDRSFIPYGKYTYPPWINSNPISLTPSSVLF